MTWFHNVGSVNLTTLNGEVFHSPPVCQTRKSTQEMQAVDSILLLGKPSHPQLRETPVSKQEWGVPIVLPLPFSPAPLLPIQTLLQSSADRLESAPVCTNTQVDTGGLRRGPVASGNKRRAKKRAKRKNTPVMRLPPKRRFVNISLPMRPALLQRRLRASLLERTREKLVLLREERGRSARSLSPFESYLREGSRGRAHPPKSLLPLLRLAERELSDMNSSLDPK